MKYKSKELRVNIDEQVAKQLEELAALGNFRSLSAAAAYIISFYTAPTVAGMQESREIVQKMQAVKETGLVS
ncbi:hypothetical protein [Merismopedia glauca]|uniref:CopG family transcriptional regulator n=1 Tax=Merismopedia glauca CCAP 1448/3 TaxID=1296344 RepID=A0A2T1C2P4_9CYAN|nr:hypothetical protein [Merismopedia glauca]PSB02393.1 hypothetical protein C7B64_13485 [Merismopedia glauca CCAP 1448/3]